MEKPKLNQINTIYENKFVKLYDLQYEDNFHYYLSSRKEKKSLVCNNKNIVADAVTCIVIVNEEKMLLFYEYRYPIGEYILSVPSGLCDEVGIVSAVKREIFEETGILIKEEDSIKVINPLLFSTPGFSDESSAFVCVKIQENNIHFTNKENTGAEKVKGYYLVDREEAKAILKTGKDPHGFYYSIATWVALAYFAYNM